MFEHVKANLFTIHGVLTTVLHVFIVVGFVTSYVVFQTQVMGIDPMAPLASTASGSHGKR